MRSTSPKSWVAISRQSSPKTRTPRPWLMWMPSHGRHAGWLRVDAASAIHTRKASSVDGTIHTYMHVRNGAATPSTQAERSARTRSALLESAARGLSRYGYGNLVLEQVAREAGYTRGALYHQFKDKEELALAVIHWVDETWRREVGGLVDRQPNPVAALIALARGHAIYCRRDVARF